MTVHLVTFSDDSMSRSREMCATSALEHGVDTADAFNQHVLNSMPHYPSDRSDERGCGYWSWKPAILQFVLPALTDGDILIYADAGVEFIENVNHIIDRMDQDIFLFGNQWEHAHWCKGDIVQEVWPDTYGATPWEFFGKQVQASVIFFRVNDMTRAFVKEWLDWCLFEGGRLIDDSPSRTPNHPEFQENRHDQAILTTMAYRDGIKLHYWPASYNDGAFSYPRDGYESDTYGVLFNHHRRRNHEWSSAA